MTHTRYRKFNTRETYPEQRLDNDLCQVVATHGGTTLWMRGQCPQELDTAKNLASSDPVEQTHKVMQNIRQLIEEAGGICLGITCVVDRTKPEAPSPIPILASALKLDLPNYAPEECPICKEGKLPLVHLGSRKMKQEAKQTL